jgi:hypothetical protein
VLSPTAMRSECGATRSSILFSVAELSQPKISDRARAADNESLPGGVNDSSYRARNSRNREGNLVQDIGGLVNPTALVPGARKDLLNRLPEAEHTISPPRSK